MTTLTRASIEPDPMPVFKTAAALQSLRDSGHSLPTALAEVVDNSVEAQAEIVRIHFDEGFNDEGKRCITRIVIADDGDGMDATILSSYLTIGFSTRYMSDVTIGKYGVGAKLAALNFARRVDVWSRTDRSESWSHVYLDLDEALERESKGERVDLRPPTAVTPPDDIGEYFPDGTGTVVLWSAVDRLEHGRAAKDARELTSEVQKELSRIFRFFLDRGMTIEVQGRRLLPHDPLMLMEKTWSDLVLAKAIRDGRDHFPSTTIADEEIPLQNSSARVRLTLYPPEVTRERGVGGDELAKQLRLLDNRGAISFVRQEREVSYTNVPRIFGRAVQDPDRFIGIEVSFTPELDDYFGIRNVKRGVEPHGELRERLRAFLQTHVKTARTLLRDAWGKREKEKQRHEGKHSTLEELLKEIDSTIRSGRARGEEADVEVQRIYEELAEDSGYGKTPEEKKRFISRVRELPYVIQNVDFPGSMFVEILFVEGRAIIRLNTRHRFYKELWEPLHNLATREHDDGSSEIIATAKRAVDALTLMLVSYAKAQSMVEDPHQYDELTMDWGKFLNVFLSKVVTRK